MQFKPEMLHCYLIGGSQDVEHDPTKFILKLTTACQAGITAFQFREKSNLVEYDVYALGFQVRTICSQFQVPLFVDDNLELAQKINADGIHVGQKDQPIEEVIKAAGHDLMIGYSCNTVAQVEHANQVQVDYIGSGPIYPTKSKADADPALGVKELGNLVQISRHPVVAIGGITPTKVPEVLTSGCAGISAIAGIFDNLAAGMPAGPDNPVSQILDCY